MAARVLVVDDEPDIASAIVDLAQASLPGVDTVTASCGAEALERLREGRFDLIVTDVRMPGMSGFELLARASAIAPGVPAIMMTAFPDLDTVLAAVNERRARGFLMKPLEPARLLGTMREALLPQRCA